MSGASGKSAAVVFAAIVLGACSFETTITVDALVKIPDAPPGAWLTGYTHRKPVLVTRTGNMLENYPLAIVFASDSNLAAHARTDGRDIVVTGGDAMTPIDSELVSYSSSTGALELWTRVPMLPSGPTVLYVYYGGAQRATNASAVFPSARFKGVWHLSDATPAMAADSTTNAHVLAAVAPSIPAPQLGIAGSARSHDGADDALQIPDPGDNSLDAGMQSFAFSMWIYSLGPTGQYDLPLFKGGTSMGSPGYCILAGSVTPWVGKIHDGTAITSYVEIPLAATVQTNKWVHLAIVVDRSTSPAKARGYVNGVETASLDVTLGSLDTARELAVGMANASPFHGGIDEVRIYNTALTPDWIATEYANLATPGFIAKGAEEAMP